MGGMKGPRSFIAAGELADGLHHALSYSREAYDYVVENVREGRRRARAATSTSFDIGAWVVTVVSEDSAAAKQAARILVAFYISSMPPEQLERHGIDAAGAPAGGRGARRRATWRRRSSCSRPELRPRSSRWPGTPEEVRGEDQDRHRAGRGQPHDPRALRLAIWSSSSPARTSRACRTSSGQLQPRGRPGDAGVQLI